MRHDPLLYMNQPQLNEFLDAARRQGYAAALRDRREQILAAPHHDLCAIKRDYPCNCWRGEQLAAIEALGEER